VCVCARVRARVRERERERDVLLGHVSLSMVVEIAHPDALKCLFPNKVLS